MLGIHLIRKCQKFDCCEGQGNLQCCSVCVPDVGMQGDKRVLRFPDSLFGEGCVRVVCAGKGPSSKPGSQVSKRSAMFSLPPVYGEVMNTQSPQVVGMAPLAAVEHRSHNLNGPDSLMGRATDISLLKECRVAYMFPYSQVKCFPLKIGTETEAQDEEGWGGEN